MMQLQPSEPSSQVVFHFVSLSIYILDFAHQATQLPECIELVDERYLSAANKYGASSRKWREEPGLFIKFQGSEPIIEAAAGEVQEIVKGFGGNNWAFAMDKAEGEELWLDRKNGLFIGLSMRPGARGVSTDVWLVTVWVLKDLDVDLLWTVFHCHSYPRSFGKRRKI
jgi:FAD/FMN-containing dehydrogenase